MMWVFSTAISVNLASATLIESPIEIIKDHAVFRPSVLKRTRYLIAFLGIFIFVGCVAVGAVFADLCNKKRNSQKKSNCFSSILLHRGYNPNHPHKLQKAAVSQSDSPTQRPFRFLLRLNHIRPSPPLRTQTATGSIMPPQSEARSPGSSST